MLTDNPYRLLLRALNFQVDTLETKRSSYMIRLTYKFGHVTQLIYGLRQYYSIKYAITYILSLMTFL